MDVLEILKKHYACDEGKDWWKGLGKTTPKKEWELCPRGDWLLWLMVELQMEEELLRKVLRKCIKPLVPLVPQKHQALCRKVLRQDPDTDEGRADQKELQDLVDLGRGFGCAVMYACYDAVDTVNFDLWAPLLNTCDALENKEKGKKLNKKFAKIVRKEIPWRLVKKAVKMKGYLR